MNGEISSLLGYKEGNKVPKMLNKLYDMAVERFN